MTARDEWGPWIDGFTAPSVGDYLLLDLRDEKGRGDILHEAVLLSIDAEGSLHLSPQLKIARVWVLERYRIRKPPGLTILQDLIADLPAPVRESEDA